MDILIDTNILISAFLFSNKKMKKFLTFVSTEHNLCLCSYSLTEMADVLNRKFPSKIKDVEKFLLSFSYTFIHSPTNDSIPDILGEMTVRDKKDNPILASAITADVDILITGDKDFSDLSIERPKILTISEFMNTYCGN